MSFTWSATEGAFEPQSDVLRGLGVERIGPYRVLEKVGEGGMGVVYRARDEAIGRDVAIKLLLASRQASPAQRQRFEREAKALGQLHHPQLLTVHSSGEIEGIPYMVTEWLGGEPLSGLVRRKGRLEPRRAAELVASLAGAVAYAHGRGILHRDIKPENVVLVPGRGPVLLDFGLAKRSDPGASHMTRSGTFAGTVAYAAPEQLLDASKVDERADVYSLGATLFCLLTGESPVQRLAGLPEVLAAAASGNLPRPRDFVPEVPPALDAIAVAAMAPSKERTDSAASLADALDAFLAPRPARVSGPWLRVALAGAVCLGLVGAGAALATVARGPSKSASAGTESSLGDDHGPATPGTTKAAPSDLPPGEGATAEDPAIAALRGRLDELVRHVIREEGGTNEVWAKRVATLDELFLEAVEAARRGGQRGATGAALADAGRFDEALAALVEARARGSLRAELCWGSTRFASGSGAGEAQAAFARLAQGSEGRGADGATGEAGSPAGGEPAESLQAWVARLARAWSRFLSIGRPTSKELEALLEEVVSAAAWERAPWWLAREAWVACAAFLSRVPDAGARLRLLSRLGPLEVRHRPPLWSHAFADLWLEGWGQIKMDLPKLRSLELLVRHRPTAARVRALAELAALRGLLGTLRGLDDLQTGAELRGCRQVADEFATRDSAPRLLGATIMGDHVTITLAPDQQAVRFLWDLPPGPWTIRARGAVVDIDLFVRDDAPPSKGDPRLLRGGTMARDEQVTSDPERLTAGIHQVLVERANPWPEPISLVLELERGSRPLWTTPWSLEGQGPLPTEFAGMSRRAREAHQAGRLAEARALLQPMIRALPEQVLVELSLLVEAGEWVEVRALVGRARGARPELTRVLAFEAGRAAAAEGDPAAATALFRQVLAGEPTALAVQEELALAEAAQGQLAAATGTLRSVLERDSSQRPAKALLELIGRLQSASGELVAAQAIRLAEEHPRAQELLVRFLLGSKRHEAALRLLKGTRGVSVRRALWQVEALIGLGRLAEAREVIARARRGPLAPGHRRALEVLGARAR
ncbi:MAG: protein kinase [Planctomycetota bacterium]